MGAARPLTLCRRYLASTRACACVCACGHYYIIILYADRKYKIFYIIILYLPTTSASASLPRATPEDRIGLFVDQMLSFISLWYFHFFCPPRRIGSIGVDCGSWNAVYNNIYATQNRRTHRMKRERDYHLTMFVRPENW